MTKRKKTVLLSSLEVILLIATTLSIMFLRPNILNPLGSVLCALGIDESTPIAVFAVLALVVILFLILLMWRRGNIYIKMALSYAIFSLCAFIVFIRFILPRLMGPL